MTRKLTPADLALLADVAGLRLPTEDLDSLADALEAHRAFMAPLLEADLGDADPALMHDLRWRE